MAVAEEAEVVAEVAAEEAEEEMVDAGDLSEAGAAAQVCVKIQMRYFCTCESTAVCYAWSHAMLMLLIL